MSRLRRNKDRPPQMVHVNVTVDQHDTLTLMKSNPGQPFYEVIAAIMERNAELEFINKDLKQSLSDSRMIRGKLEEKIVDLQSMMNLSGQKVLTK